jgi:hypothetical protein
MSRECNENIAWAAFWGVWFIFSVLDKQGFFAAVCMGLAVFYGFEALSTCDGER